MKPMNVGTRLEQFHLRQPAASVSGFGVVDAAPGPALAEACRKFGRERGIPLRVAASAVFAALVSRLTGSAAVSLLEVGGVRRLLVCEAAGERTFLELFRDSMRRNEARTDVPGPDDSGLPDRMPTNCGIAFAGAEPAEVDGTLCGLQALLVVAAGEDDPWKLSLRFDRSAFTEPYARDLLRYFLRLLEFAVRRPEARLSEADMLDEVEIGRLLRTPEDVRPGLPGDETIPALIESAWAGAEDETAVRFGGRSVPFREIDALANRIAHYLIAERGIRREERVAILLERRPELIAAMLGVLKAGGAYVPVDPDYPEERIRHMVADSGARTVLSGRKWTRLLNRLQWECPDLTAWLCIDSDDALAEPEAEHNMLMDRGLWEYVGEKAGDDIAGGGWFNSYTGEPFSAAEMEEFAENVYRKLRPWLRPDARVLEIGCASGLTMFRLAPHVGYYFGTDLSRIILDKVRARIEEEGIRNIALACAAAHEIGSIPEGDFDIVVMNSVIQVFHGHNYLRAAIGQALDKMADKGILFIGDIMDLDLKEELCRSTAEHKRANPGHRTKTDWSSELFVSRAFLEDLLGEFPALRAVEFSRKHGEIENELTRFRFDAVFHVDKSGSTSAVRAKHKHQHDRRHLARHPDTRPETRADAGQLAYVLYTSGSTGRPKGVMIEHRAVVNFLEGMKRLFPVSRGSKVLSLTTVSFDIFVLESLFPLVLGGTIVLADETEQREPDALERLMRSEAPDLVQMTPSRMHAFLQEESRLSALADVPYLLLGGEPLPDSLLRRLNGHVRSRIFNMYGPTETTVWSTAEDVTGRTEVNIGGPILGTEVLILDTVTGRPLPEGAVGEIGIAGAGLARGYLNLPRETGAKFVPHPCRPAERIYRTGDLGVRLPDGKFLCLGRIDHQIKVRGYRIEPAEIENALAACEGIREAAVAAHGTGGDGEAVLCAYYTTDGRTPAVRELRAQLARKLPDYMIPTRFVQLERMPLTPNGKIDRRALPSPEESARTGAAHRAPRSAAERALADIWADVFGVPVGIADDFYEIGGHSILAVKLVAAIREKLGVGMTLEAFFRRPTIEGVARLVEAGGVASAGSRGETVFLPSRRERVHEPFPLDEMQQAYWLGGSGDFESGGLPTHVYFELACDELDHGRLERALNRLIAHQDMLRSVILEDGTQRILPRAPWYRVETEDWSGLGEEEQSARLAELRRRMRLDCNRTGEWPLFQVRATRLGERRALVHVCYNAVMMDLQSQAIFVETLDRLYRDHAAPLPPLAVGYRDFVLHKRLRTESEVWRASKRYWLDRLDGLPPAPELPARTAAAAEKRELFARTGRVLPAARWDRFRERCRHAGVTPFVALLTAFGAVVSYWSEKQRFTLNVPSFDRADIHPDVDRLIGQFATFLFVEMDRVRPVPFLAEARAVQEQFWARMEHRHFHGVEVLREMARRMGGTTKALMPVVFTSVLHLGGGRPGHFRPGYWATQTSQVHLDVFVSEQDGELRIDWDYLEDRFPDGLIDRMADAYADMVARLADAEESWHRTGWDFLPPEDREVIRRANDTDGPLPDSPLAVLLEESLAMHRDHVAVRWPGGVLRYGELFDRARRIAGELTARGLKPEEPVAVVTEKGWEQAAAMLGIVLAGGACMPLAADWPPERLDYCVRQAGARLLLTQSWLEERLVAVPGCEAIAVDRAAEREPHRLEPANGPDGGSDPDRLAFVIYTSGSTGMPKGVMIGERGLVNALLHTNRTFGIGSADRVLALTNLHHDMALYDLFGMLLAGGTVVIPDRNRAKDPAHWHDLVTGCGVTVWNSVPAMLEMLLDYVPNPERAALYPSLRHVFTGGDRIPVELPRRVREAAPGAEVRSVGGPTETTLWNIWHVIGDADPAARSIPYGKPIANAKYHILNERLEPVPIGVTGMMYCEGVGVAKGYINDPDRTREAFITHPATGRRLYRTGDLGRYLDDGTIEFCGRQDFQVKINGQRIELGEIEHALVQHPDVRRPVVTADTGRKRLVAFYLGEREIDPGELRNLLAGKLPPHMIPHAFIRLDRYPLTANGKVDHRRLQALHEDLPAVREDGPSGGLSDIERRLRVLYGEMLGIRDVPLHDNFFSLGGNSLTAVRMIRRVKEEWGVSIPIVDFFRDSSVRAIGGEIGRKLAERTPAGEASPVPGAPSGEAVPAGRLPLSYAQAGICFREMVERSSRYCLSASVEIGGPLDTDRLRHALEAVMRRHPVLRTRVAQADGRPVLEIMDDPVPPLIVEDMTGLRERVEALKEAEIRTPFDVHEGPLIRATLAREAADRHTLIVTLHHLIADEHSFGRLFEELRLVYAEGDWTDTAAPAFAAFTPDARTEAEDLSYWSGILREPAAYVALPTEREPAWDEYFGEYHPIALGDDAVGRFVELCRRRGASPFAGFCAVLDALLYRISGEADIVVGTPVSTRRTEEDERRIGMYVHMLPLRTRLAPDMTFTALLDRMKETAGGAMAHASMPFEELAARLGLDRRLIHLPYHVVFNFIDSDRTGRSAGGLVWSPVRYTKGIVMHNLGLFIERVDGRYHGYFSCKRGLFAAETMERLAALFRRLVERIPEQADIPIRDLAPEDREPAALSHPAMRERFRFSFDG